MYLKGYYTFLVLTIFCKRLIFNFFNTIIIISIVSQNYNYYTYYNVIDK